MPDPDDVRTYVERLADAPTLESLPPVVDPTLQAPLNPPRRIQQKFVGSSYLEAYAEAERFVSAAFARWPSSALADQTVLDFGSGWGRITRLLLSRLRADQVWSSDVDAQMTVLLHSTLPGVNAVTNAPMPPTVFNRSTFDAVTAFSVFSHLSEEAHRAWSHEFARVTRVGSKVYITVLEEHFLDQVAGAQRAAAAGTADAFSESLAAIVPDAAVAREQFRKGLFVFGGGDDLDGPRSTTFYGWAAAPRSWIEQVWGGAGFVIESWVPTGELFEQAMVVLTRVDSRPIGRASRFARRAAGALKRRFAR